MTRPHAGTPARAWLRWSWRDLRAHWVAVVAIATVLAIGTGVYAGLGSTAAWRRESNDASFAALAMHDLKVELSPGTFVPEGALLAALEASSPDGDVVAARERLVVWSQVDSAPIGNDDPVLVPARIVGMDFSSEGPVDAVWIREGTIPGAGTGLLETKFAEAHTLPPRGELMVAGGGRLPYTGLGASPEDFFYEGPEGTIFSQSELAILYMPLTTAQRLAGRAGRVNDLVLRIADRTRRDAVRDRLATALDARGISALITTREDSDSIRVLYEDIDNDQRFWNALSGLVLAAAALAAFNLLSRIVEAQRREIGIGMALGVPRRQLAIRPLLIGIQIAVLGTLAGVGVGLLVGIAYGDLLRSVLPLPVHLTPFQPQVYARAAVLSMAVPIIASALPVWRAVRVEPIQAIRTGHLTAKSSRLTDWTRHVRLPGSSLGQMALRNVLRTPRRSLFTAVGVAAAITALVAVLGMLDSFGRALDQADAELTRGGRDRVVVQLDTFHPIDSQVVRAVAASPGVARVDPAIRVPVTASGNDGGMLDVLVEVLDFDRARWTPSRTRTAGTGGRPGIVIAGKAADDLAVVPGETIRVRHPALLPGGAIGLTESEFVVSGIHGNPMRLFAYVDLGDAGAFGLGGVTNVINAYPAAGTTPGALQRQVFDLPGVTSSQPVTRVSEAIDEALDTFTGFLYVTALAVLALALLIAFNATRITLEERRREHATMRAFGVPLGSVVGVVVRETVVVGVVATVLGLLAGTVFLRWMLGSLAATTMPDVSIATYVAPTTVVVAGLVGVVAVAAAPLFLVPRLKRMNLPDTLRVME